MSLSEEYYRNMSKAEKEKIKRILARAKIRRRPYDELETAIVLLLVRSSPPGPSAIGWEEDEISLELYRRLIIDKRVDYYLAGAIKVKLSQERKRFANQVRYRLKRLADLGAIRTWKQWVDGRGLREMGAEIRYYGL
jgi:hypothetical protein